MIYRSWVYTVKNFEKRKMGTKTKDNLTTFLNKHNFSEFKYVTVVHNLQYIRAILILHDSLRVLTLTF